MFVFLALSILYPNDRLSGFAMATKTCRAVRYGEIFHSPSAREISRHISR